MSGTHFLIISDYDRTKGGAGVIASFEYNLLLSVVSAERIVAFEDNADIKRLSYIRLFSLNIRILLLFLFRSNTKAVVHTFSFFPVIKIITFFWKNKITFVIHDYLLICPSKSLYNSKSESICRKQGYSMACLSADCGYPLAKKISNTVTTPRRFQQSVRVLSDTSAKFLNASGRRFGALYTMRNFDVSSDASNFCLDVRNEHLVLFCGRYSKDKGFDVFLRLAETSRALNVRFVCCGDGEILPNSFVQNLGWLSQEDVSALINQSDLVVYPSRQIDADPLIFQNCLRFKTPMLVPSWNAAAKNVEEVFGKKYIYQDSRDVDIAHILDQSKRDGLQNKFDPKFPTSIDKVYNLT